MGREGDGTGLVAEAEGKDAVRAGKDFGETGKVETPCSRVSVGASWGMVEATE